MGRLDTASDADILGIVAIILAIIGFFFEGIIFGLVAILLAAIGFKRDRNNIYCIIGLILGVICLILGLVGLIQQAIKPLPGQNK